MRPPSASTALDDVDDTADNPPVIHASLAPRVSRKMRLELRELFARQPEMVPIHRSLQSVTLNHGSRINESDLWVRTLAKLTKPRLWTLSSASRAGSLSDSNPARKGGRYRAHTFVFKTSRRIAAK